MSDRDRLRELFQEMDRNPEITCPKPNDVEACKTCEYAISKFLCDLNARKVDYHLANGVIVPPCNIGQTVYTRYGYSFKIEKFEILEDKKIIFRCGNDGTDDYMAFYDFEIGTDVFLTKEEAEKALAERSGDNAKM